MVDCSYMYGKCVQKRRRRFSAKNIEETLLPQVSKWPHRPPLLTSSPPPLPLRIYHIPQILQYNPLTAATFVFVKTLETHFPPAVVSMSLKETNGSMTALMDRPSFVYAGGPQDHKWTFILQGWSALGARQGHPGQVPGLLVDLD